MKHKPTIFIDPRLIFDQRQYEKLIRQTTKSDDVREKGKSDQQDLQWQTVIGQEFAINIICSECDASKRNETYYENCSIKLTLPRCLLNHGNGNGELNYSTFKSDLIEKGE